MDCDHNSAKRANIFSYRSGWSRARVIFSNLSRFIVKLLYLGDINHGPACWWPFQDCSKDRVRFLAANKLFKEIFLKINEQTCNHQPALSSHRPGPLPRNQSCHSHRWCGLPGWATASPWSPGHFLAPRTTPGTQHPRQTSAPLNQNVSDLPGDNEGHVLQKLLHQNLPWTPSWRRN